MKLSAPVHVLKSQAKQLKRTQAITMTEALDAIAQREGFSSWSLLQSKAKDMRPRTIPELFDYLNPGDLMLLSARPGQGKTKYALKILAHAMKQGRTGFLFSLENTRAEIDVRFTELGENVAQFRELFHFYDDDAISSSYIIERTQNMKTENSVVVVDYLQILDHARSKPPLQEQITELKAFAKKTRSVMVFISQVDRKFEDGVKGRPDLQDIRLPNPLDLGLFNKSFFLHDGTETFDSPKEFLVD